VIASIGLIVSLGVVWRIWFADLERGATARIVVSIIVTAVVALLSVNFITGGEI